MALDRSAIGRPIGPIVRNYDCNDVILYALSVGAGFDELHFTWEKDLKVIPTFSVATIFDFFWTVAKNSQLNPKGALHGEQEILFHNPIPTSGTLTTNGTITNYFDKGKKGAVIRGESVTFHSSGRKLYTNVMSIFSRLDGGFGGVEGSSRAVEFPGRGPDFIVDALPSPDQPLLYRLTGDFFALHVDPDFARASGFEKPIMHGLCTFGFACRALMKSLIPGEPELTTRIACRFTRPLYPGEPIRTLIWNTEEGKALWRVIHAGTSQTVIDSGEFEYRGR
jgi:acyl dehydratase